MGGSVEKINPKSLGSVFSLCCRAGVDAALVKADFLSAGVPTIENKIEQKIQNTTVASAKVAFDTVRKVWDYMTEFRGCGATPLPHLQNAIKSRKSAATRVARQV